LCKELLSKFTPATQLEIILQNLLLHNHCPQPGLRPKILDMLRPLLVQVCSSTTTAAAVKSSNSILSCQMDSRNDNDSIRNELWHALEVMICGLGKYCVVNNRCDDGGDNIRIQNVEDLIDEVEYMVSACSMLKLGWNVMHNTDFGIEDDKNLSTEHPRALVLELPTNKQIIITVQDFQRALQVQLERWQGGNKLGTDKDAPNEFFRLGLLDNALQEIIHLQ